MVIFVILIFLVKCDKVGVFFSLGKCNNVFLVFICGFMFVFIKYLGRNKKGRWWFVFFFVLLCLLDFVV